MFAACDKAFDRGRLIAIYREGATHSGAAASFLKSAFSSDSRRGGRPGPSPAFRG